MTTLTARQGQILGFLSDFRETKGYCCTMREIADFLGISSLKAIDGHLRALRRKGYVTWEDGLSRTIRPLPGPKNGN